MGICSSKRTSKQISMKPLKLIRKVLLKCMSRKPVLEEGQESTSSGGLFGQDLENLFKSNNNSLPVQLYDMMAELFENGPSTEGIFRKSANVRRVREVREKLEAGAHVKWDELDVVTIAAALKEFCRSLPDALMCSRLYDDWIALVDIEDSSEKIRRISAICDQIRPTNLSFLKFFLCVLNNISQNSSNNMMTSHNLGICVGPSLLWPSGPNLIPIQESMKKSASAIEFLVDNLVGIFGKNISSSYERTQTE